MDTLLNLKDLANDLVNKYQSVFTGEEIQLPIEFKQRVKSINSNSIEYQEYSAIVSTKGVQKGVLNIYLPNQWFYIASFFTAYYKELQKYKQITTELFSTERLKTLKGGSLTTSEKNKLTNRLSADNSGLIEKFVTDYDWWGGGKTIDRTDFYVSPILNYARLVNATQSYVADLCAFLAENDDLVSLLYNTISEQGDVSRQSLTKSIDYFKKNPLQQIFYGAPGTGKSHEVKKLTMGQKVIRTTFHPDSDYSTFVGAYKPTTKQVPMRDVTGKVIKENGVDVEEDRIIYEFVEQAFLQAYINAWKFYAQTDEKEPEKQYLIIEEINRGNCAQIFGDLFQLLDRNKVGFSEYPIKADNDMKKHLAKAFDGLNIANKDAINQYFDGKDEVSKVFAGDELLLPNNLYIWATMNTSDQSLFPIDSAFKRRWEWKYIPIDTKKESWSIQADGVQYDWSDFLEKINAKIEAATASEDKMLGFYFCKAENSMISAERFVNKVLFYLWNDVFKDYGFDDAVFNDENNEKLTFRNFYMADGEVDESKVQKFLDNLQVSGPRGNHDEDDDEKAAGVSEKQLRFWEGFNEARGSHDEYSKIYTEKKPLAQQWMDLAFGTSAYYPSLSVVFTKSIVRVLIWISGSNRSAEIFEHFKENESALNEITGVNLDFKESKTSYSIIAERSINVNDESTWDDAYKWMMSMAIKMKSIKDRFGI